MVDETAEETETASGSVWSSSVATTAPARSVLGNGSETNNTQFAKTMTNATRRPRSTTQPGVIIIHTAKLETPNSIYTTT